RHLPTRDGSAEPLLRGGAGQAIRPADPPRPDAGARTARAGKPVGGRGSGGDLPVGAVSAAATAVRVPVGGVSVDGDLTVPDAALGVVLFAHGSGSSRHSPRNRYVAEALQEARLA